MTDAPEWSADAEWDVDLDVDVVGGKASYEVSEPEDGETLKEYAPRVAREAGISSIAVKLNGDFLAHNGDEVERPVSELSGTLEIGKYDVLA